MRLAETIAHLNGLGSPANAGAGDRLADLDKFGGDLGNLRARFYVPGSLADGAPLVVVLHGCTQTAAAYDHGSGWSTLADRHGFALLFPEQRRANNANLCFNWFEPGDTARGQGEAASIAEMIERMVRDHRIDRDRIFVTGLSAGGAMTSVMLAAYPDLFAAGAIIAGLAYGSAASVGEAMTRMRGAGQGDAATLGGRVRSASPHDGRWPRVSVWQGGADHVVAPANADAILAQWTSVHGLKPRPDASVTDGARVHEYWRAADGTTLVEHHRIAGFGHGTPLMAGKGEGELGAAGPHMLDAGINSTAHIAAFFGITPPVSEPRLRREPAPARHTARVMPAANGAVGKVIEDALKAAGLMR